MREEEEEGEKEGKERGKGGGGWKGRNKSRGRGKGEEENRERGGEKENKEEEPFVRRGPAATVCANQKPCSRCSEIGRLIQAPPISKSHCGYRG